MEFSWKLLSIKISLPGSKFSNVGNSTSCKAEKHKQCLFSHGYWITICQIWCQMNFLIVIFCVVPALLIIRRSPFRSKSSRIFKILSRVKAAHKANKNMQFYIFVIVKDGWYLRKLLSVIIILSIKIFFIIIKFINFLY